MIESTTKTIAEPSDGETSATTIAPDSPSTHVAQPESAAPPPWLRRALLVAILTLAAAIRLHHIGGRSFWIDEQFTQMSLRGMGLDGWYAIPYDRILPQAPPLTDATAMRPWWTTLRPDFDDLHPPLYPFTARVWSGAFGTGESGLRSLSAVFSTIAILLLYVAVRELSGDGPALWAAFLMAVAMPQFELAQEARSYAMLQALALGAVAALLRIERRGLTSTRLAALAAALLLTLFTHYFGAAAVVAATLYACIRLRGQARVRTVGACAAVALVFCIAWGWVIYRQAHGASSRGTTIFIDEADGHTLHTAWRLALLPTRFLFEPLPNVQRATIGIGLICLLPLALLRRRRDLLLWIIWLPLTVAPALWIDLRHTSDTLDRLRYTLLASSAVYAILATVGRSFPNRVRYALPALIAFACVIHNAPTFVHGQYDPYPWRSFAKAYRDIAKPGDVTIFCSASEPQGYPRMYLVCVGYYANQFPGPIALLMGKPSPELVTQLRHFTGGVLVGDGWEPEGFISGATTDRETTIPFMGHIARFTWKRNAATQPS